jgi:hypothetical protein
MHGHLRYFSEQQAKRFAEAMSAFTFLVRTADDESLTEAANFLIDTIKAILIAVYDEQGKEVRVIDMLDADAGINRAWEVVANDGLRDVDAELSGEIMVALDRIAEAFKAVINSNQVWARSIAAQQ